MQFFECLFWVIHCIAIITSLHHRCYYLCLIQEETEAQRDEVTFPGYFLFRFSPVRHLFGPEGLSIARLEMWDRSKRYQADSHLDSWWQSEP